MIFSLPPQFGRCSRSISNMRLSKRANITNGIVSDRSSASTGFWPTAGALSIDFIVSLQTAMLCLQRLLGSRQIEKLYARIQSKAVVGRALLPCAASRAVITVARDSVESRATAEPVWPEVSRECLAQELQYARPRLGIRMCISSRRAATDLTPYSSNCLARHAAALTTLHSRGSPLAQRYARCETIRAAGRGSRSNHGLRDGCNIVVAVTAIRWARHRWLAIRIRSLN